MIEFLFFNKAISEKFIALLRQNNIDWIEETEAVQEAINIKISEDIGDALWDELDDFYEILTAEDQLLLEQNVNDDDLVSTAGIYLQLADGKQTIAKIKPDVMNRMLEVISIDEFNDFIETIVSSVENPDDTPICKPEVIA